jgi:hypothetical protein
LGDWRLATTNQGNQNALIQHLSQAVIALQAGDLIDAAHKLEQAIACSMH